MHREGARWHWIADSYPANAVSLRSIAEGNFVGDRHHRTASKDVIAEVDYSSARDDALRGRDLHGAGRARGRSSGSTGSGARRSCATTSADYYTDAIDYTKLKMLDEFDAGEHGRSARAAHGEVHVVRRVAGYKKIRYYTHENVGYGQRATCPTRRCTRPRLWWEADPQALARAFRDAAGRRSTASSARRTRCIGSPRSSRSSEPHDIGRAVGDGGPEGAGRRRAGTDGRAEARDARRRAGGRRARAASRSGRRSISTTTIPAASASPRRSSTCATR